jgi:hypothetical protein
MKDLPKGKDKVRAHIFSMIWKADHDNSRVATEAVRRILNSFGGREDGRKLADGLIQIIDYYVLVGYWRGYRDAKRHYETKLRNRKTPADRTNAERVVAFVLGRDENTSTKEICKSLDDAGVSGGFGREDFFGLRMGARKARQGERWIDGSSEQAVVQWIYRIRKRIRTERLGNMWLRRSAEISREP